MRIPITGNERNAETRVNVLQSPDKYAMRAKRTMFGDQVILKTNMNSIIGENIILLTNL